MYIKTEKPVGGRLIGTRSLPSRQRFRRPSMAAFCRRGGRKTAPTNKEARMCMPSHRQSRMTFDAERMARQK